MDVAGEAVNGTFAVVPYVEANPDPKVQNFIAAFKAKHGTPPLDFMSPLTYDAVMMLAQAAKQAGGPENHVKLRDAFKTIKGYRGATGLAYTLGPNGESVHELILIQYENLRHKVIMKVAGD